LVVKIVLLGDGGVGKTALRLRYMGVGFQSSYLATIGADFAFKEISFHDQPAKLQIWDLAGQQHYTKIRKNYYFGAHAVVLVFDVTRLESYHSLETWIQEIKANIKADVPIVLVGNKIDLRAEIKNHLVIEDGHKAKDKFQKDNTAKVFYIETSAKTGENVENTFMAILEELDSMYS